MALTVYNDYIFHNNCNSVTAISSEDNKPAAIFHIDNLCKIAIARIEGVDRIVALSLESGVEKSFWRISFWNLYFWDTRFKTRSPQGGIPTYNKPNLEFKIEMPWFGPILATRERSSSQALDESLVYILVWNNCLVFPKGLRKRNGQGARGIMITDFQGKQKDEFEQMTTQSFVQSQCETAPPVVWGNNIATFYTGAVLVWNLQGNYEKINMDSSINTVMCCIWDNCLIYKHANSENHLTKWVKAEDSKNNFYNIIKGFVGKIIFICSEKYKNMDILFVGCLLEENENTSSKIHMLSDKKNLPVLLCKGVVAISVACANSFLYVLEQNGTIIEKRFDDIIGSDDVSIDWNSYI